MGGWGWGGCDFTVPVTTLLRGPPGARGSQRRGGPRLEDTRGSGGVGGGGCQRVRGGDR